MEQDMEKIIKTFHQNSGKEGDPYTLSNRIPNSWTSLQLLGHIWCLKGRKDEKAMSYMVDDLNTNKDKHLSFEEIWALI
ncbi:protein S100-A9-like [Arvicanthis niloticus]|uniref:protein S100-A9-like n=1 Tax=Arvicanthis niloticus TaxID=61156 RepID=UPI00402BEC9E